MADGATEQKLPYGAVSELPYDLQAILEEAPTLETGQQALQKAYNSYEWDKPDTAREETQKYGDLLRHRFQDESTYSPAVLPDLLPVPLSSIKEEDPSLMQNIGEAAKGAINTMTGGNELLPVNNPEIIKKANQISAWEKANTDAVTNSPDSNYVVDQTKLLNSIKKTASDMRQQIYTSDKDVTGDLGIRALEGLLHGPLTAAGNTPFLKELKPKDFLQYLQEQQSDPQGSGLSAHLTRAVKNLAGGVGNIAGYELGGPLYLAGTAIGETADRYNDAYERSGDRSQAFESGALEGLNQVLNAYVIHKLVGRSFEPASDAEKAVQSAIEPVSEATNRGVTNILDTAKTMLGFAGANTVGTVITKESENAASGKPIGENALDPKAMLEAGETGGILGAFIGAVKSAGRPSTSSSGDTGQARTQTLKDISAPEEPPPGGPSNGIAGTVIGSKLNEQATNDPSELKGVKPDFKTESGDQYITTEDNSTVRVTPTGNVYHTLDKTFYIKDDATALWLANEQTKDNGDLSKFHSVVDDGKLYAVQIDKNGAWAQKILIPGAELVNDGASYPIEVNEVKNPTGNAAVYQSHIGTKTTEVSPEYAAKQDTSVGAMQAEDAGRIRTMKTALRYANSETQILPLDFVNYFQTSKIKFQSLGSDKLEEMGVEDATNHFLKVDPTHPGIDDQSLGLSLFKAYTEAHKNAVLAGDTAKAQDLAVMHKNIYEKLSQMANTTATMQYMARILKEYVTPAIDGDESLGKLKNEALNEVAKKEKIPVERLNGLGEEINNLDTKIQEQIKTEQAKVGEGQPLTESDILKDLKKQRNKLSTIKDKVENAIKEKQDKFSQEDRVALIKLAEEADKATDEATKKRYTDAISDIKKRVGLLSKEGQIKNKTLNWSAQQLGRMWSGLQGYWVSNILGPAAVIKKTSFDVLNTALAPLTYLAQGEVQAAKAFTTEVINSFYDWNAKNPIEAIKNSKAITAFLQTLATGESSKFKGEDFLKTGPSVVKYVGVIPRTLSAITEAFYITNKDAYTKAEAASFFTKDGNFKYDKAVKQAMKEGFTKGDEQASFVEVFRNKLADRLYNTEKLSKEARQEAQDISDTLEKTTGKGLSEKEKNLLVWDKMREKLPQNVLNNADIFAQKQVGINTPEGFLGYLYEGGKLLREASLGKVLGKEITPLKTPLTFMRVGFNVLNASANFSPLGIFRGLRETATSFERGERTFREKDSHERTQEMLRGAIGTAGMALIMSYAWDNKDKPFPSFMVHGDAGQLNWKVKQQMMAEGYLPKSVQFGNRYISFADSLFVVPLGVLGNIMDAVRYGKDTHSDDVMEKVKIGAISMLAPLTDLSMFKAVTDFSEMVTNVHSDPERAADKFFDLIVGNNVKGLIPFYGTSKFLDMNPIDTSKNMWSKLISGVPYAEALSETRPALNYFGEPISSSLTDRLTVIPGFSYKSSSVDNVSPEWRFLAMNGITLPQDQNITIELFKKGTHPAIEKKRTEKYKDAYYADILTHDERYELIQKAGPKIKAVVTRYMANYGTSGVPTKSQENMKEEVAKIFNDTKKSMFAH